MFRKRTETTGFFYGTAELIFCLHTGLTKAGELVTTGLQQSTLAVALL